MKKTVAGLCEAGERGGRSGVKDPSYRTEVSDA